MSRFGGSTYSFDWSYEVHQFDKLSGTIDEQLERLDDLRDSVQSELTNIEEAHMAAEQFIAELNAKIEKLENA